MTQSWNRANNVLLIVEAREKKISFDKSKATKPLTSKHISSHSPLRSWGYEKMTTKLQVFPAGYMLTTNCVILILSNGMRAGTAERMSILGICKVFIVSVVYVTALISASRCLLAPRSPSVAMPFSNYFMALRTLFIKVVARTSWNTISRVS